jgi:hypothetical protein
MPLNAVDRSISKRSVLWGRIFSGLTIVFLLMDGVMKLIKPIQVTDTMARLGYRDSLSVPLGIILLVCLLLYAVPRTATLGAILLTAYLGGAVSTHVRVGDPLFSHVFFPIYLGILLWLGLFLRDRRVKGLVEST